MQRSDALRLWILPIGIFAVSVAAFGPALRAGFVNWDDPLVVTENYRFRGFGAESLGWMATTSLAGHYQPLTWMSLALDHSLFGLSPPDHPEAPGYHASSVLLHAAGAVALYFLALAILPLAVRGSSGVLPWAAAFAALLHAIHPLRCESVCWVTERRDVLSGLFFVLAVLAYVRGTPRGTPSRTRAREQTLGLLAAIGALALFFGSVGFDDRTSLRFHGFGAMGLAMAMLLLCVSTVASARAAGPPRGAWLRVACTGLLLVSLLAKAWGIVMPAVLLVLDVWPLRRLQRGNGRRGVDVASVLQLLVEKAPVAALALVFARLAHWAQTAQQGTVDVWAGHTLGERLVQALYGIAWYPVKTLLPFRLVPVHTIPGEIELFELRFLAAAVFTVGVTVLAVAGARRRPALLAVWCAYVAIVSPVLGLLQSGPQLVADRYSYLAAMPFALLGGGALLFVSVRSVGNRRRTLVLSCLALLVALAALTWKQSGIWHSSEALWTHAYARVPESPLVALNLGVVRVEQARRATDPLERAALEAEAQRLFDLGRVLRPRDERFTINSALLLANRAERMEPGERAASLSLAATLSAESVAAAEARGLRPATYYFHQGRILLQSGRADAAIASFEKAVALRPYWPAARRALGGALVDSAQQVGEVRPEDGLARSARAVETLGAALSLGAEPIGTAFLLASAHDLRAQLLTHLDRAAEAEVAREHALALYESVPEADARHVRARARALRLQETSREPSH